VLPNDSLFFIQFPTTLPYQHKKDSTGDSHENSDIKSENISGLAIKNEVMDMIPGTNSSKHQEASSSQANDDLEK